MIRLLIRLRPGALAAAIALALLTPGASAAPPRAPGSEQQARETARGYAKQGLERFEAGDFAAAADLFRKAEEHFHAPTHWLFIARAEARLGKLFNAERAYKKVLEDDLAHDAPRAFVDAQYSAREELAGLRDRIPQISVDVTGAPEGVVPEISLDGAPLDAGPRGGRTRVDPGRHVVRVNATGMLPVEQEIQVAEGEDRQVAIALQRRSPEVSPSYILPAVAFGLGAVGLGVGAVTGAMSLSRVGDLERACPDMRCTPAEQPIADDARALGTVSTIGFIAGGVFAAAGVTLLVLRPKGQPAAARGPGASLSAAATPGGVVVRGVF